MAEPNDPVIRRVKERLVSGEITKDQASKVLQAYKQQQGGGQLSPAPEVSPAETAQQPEQMPEGGALDAVIEPIQAIGGGMASQALSGLSGVAGAVMPGPEGQGLATMRQTQEALPDFQPETQAGQRGLQTVGDLIQQGIDIVNFPISGLTGLAELIGSGGDIDSAANIVKRVQEEGVGPVMGESVLESTGSPAAATAASMAPDIAGAVAGFRSAQVASKPAIAKLKKVADAKKQKRLLTPDGYLSPDFERALKKEGLTLNDVVDDINLLPDTGDPQQAVRGLLKQKLRRGDTDGSLALKKLDDMGNVVDDPIGAAAIKQGFEPGDVQAVKAAKPGSKPAMDEMLKIRQSIFNNTRKAVDVQPTDVIGRSALKRFEHIRKTADKARQELNSIANKQLKGKPINPDRVEGAFRQQLANLDVKVDDSAFPPKLNFQGSQISKNRAAQKVIKDAMDLLAEDETVDALRAHKLKRQLDEMIDYKKSGQGMLTPTGERVAKSVRRSLNDSIREVSDDYARVNDTMSQSLDALNDFSDVLGPSINPFGDNAYKAVGNDLRGLLSNRKTRTKLENAVTQLDRTAKELGGDFKDDIGDLVNFNGILQSRFGSTKRQSFAGEIGSEVKRTGQQLMQGRGGLVERGLEEAGNIVEKARNINDQEAFKAVNKLLKESR